MSIDRSELKYKAQWIRDSYCAAVESSPFLNVCFLEGCLMFEFKVRFTAIRGYTRSVDACSPQTHLIYYRGCVLITCGKIDA